MQQQINFFHFVTRPIKSPLNARLLLLLYSGFLLLLLLVYFGGSLLLSHERAQMIELDAHLDAARKNLVLLASQYPRANISTQLINSSRQPACNTKFSTYLQYFAQAQVPDLWLTDIDITDSGKMIILRGHTLQAIHAEEYLQHLKQLMPMSFQIAELNDEKSMTNFQLTGRALDVQ